MKILVQTESLKGAVKIRKTVKVIVSESGLRLGRNGDIRVEDAYCSKSHALLFLKDGSLYVRDMGSRNGTYVEGARVREMMMPRGAAFSIGRTTVRILAVQESVQAPKDNSVCRGWPAAYECLPKKVQQKFSDYV